MANLEFRDNKAGFRYEALEDGELVSQIDYTIDGGRILGPRFADV